MKGGSVMINEYINELVAYGLNQGLVDPEDEVYVTNRLLELFQLTEHEGTAKEVRSERELSQILMICWNMHVGRGCWRKKQLRKRTCLIQRLWEY